MEQVFPGIWKTPDESRTSIFVSTCAYLLCRPQGNILISSYSHLQAYYPLIHEQGGIDFQLLSHHHEAGDHCRSVNETFGSQLIAHSEETKEIEAYWKVSNTITEDHQLDENTFIFHIPGHSPGGICLLWKHEGKQYLFSGNNLYNSRGHWHFDITHGSREAALSSIEKLRSLQVDVILSSLSVGEQKIEIVNPDKWQWILNDCYKRLEQGFYH